MKRKKEIKVMAKAKTKAEILEGIKETLATNFEATDVAEYVEFIDKELAAIAKRAADEKARRAEKKAQGDELGDAVKAAIGAEAITADAIAEALAEQFPDVTKAKVTYRATQLVKAGEIFKVTIKADGRKIVAYTTEEPVEDAE
jgi:CO dehydrogenase/acetyl-CoA synthase beta subunit